MNLRNTLKTISGLWDMLDSVALAALILFVVAALGYAGFSYFTG